MRGFNWACSSFKLFPTLPGESRITSTEFPPHSGAAGSPRDRTRLLATGPRPVSPSPAVSWENTALTVNSSPKDTKSEFQWKPVQLSLLIPASSSSISRGHPCLVLPLQRKGVVTGPGSWVCRAVGAALGCRHLRFFLRTSTHLLSFSLPGGPDSLKAIYFSHPRQLRFP